MANRLVVTDFGERGPRNRTRRVGVSAPKHKNTISLTTQGRAADLIAAAKTSISAGRKSSQTYPSGQR